jgi:mono/diheme cytochrome c family protein
MIMLKVIVCAGSISALIAPAIAEPVRYRLPDEMVLMKPGKNFETFENNCTACHSSDYIKTQPQGAAFKTSFWQAEVTKMIKVYGAPIDEADARKIVEYLSENY